MAGDMENLVQAALTEDEIQQRLAWCAITADDLQRVQKLASWADDLAGPVIDRFYDHILAFETARGFFADAETISRIKAGQRRYFQGLTAGRCDASYFAER
jgi:hypothetical protein